MSYDLLPVEVANIKPDSQPATKEAHLQRLKQDLPDPVSFGSCFTQFGLLGGPLSHPIVTSAEVENAIAKKEAEERAIKEAEIKAKLAEELRRRAAAEREAELRRRIRQRKHEERERQR